jgi:hypothetical protein
LTKQTDKYHLSLAGEFLVAGELQRRGASAAVTYGNAKSADVVVFSGDGQKAVVVEVKRTGQAKWVVGATIPPSTYQPWVFVHIPQDPSESPSFYIILQSELRALVKPEDDEYRQQYKAKHGVDFTNRGVVNLSRSQAEPYKNKWSSILRAVGA